MQQSICIRKMMATIKLEDAISPDLYATVRNYLMQAFAAGYDNGREEALQCKNGTKVVQYNADGKIVNTYNSIREAARKTGHDFDAIKRCIEGKKTMLKDYSWKME